LEKTHPSGKLATSCQSYVTTLKLKAKYSNGRPSSKMNTTGRRNTMQKEGKTWEETEEEKIALRRPDRSVG
jgi:hypothetical protein